MPVPNTAYFILTRTRTKPPDSFWHFNDPALPEGPPIEIARFARAFKSMRLNGVVHIIFGGGEAAGMEGFPEVVRCAKMHSMECTLVTDGTFVDDGRLEALRAAGLNRIVLVLRRLTEQEAHVARRLNKIKGVELVVEFLVARGAYRVVSQVAEMAKKEKMRLRLAPIFCREDEPVKGGQDLRLLHALDWACLESLLAPHYPPDYYCLIEAAHGLSEALPERCPLAWNEMTVDPDGTVFPCAHRRDLPCGNVFEDRFPDVAKKLNERYAEIVGAPCFGRHCVSRFEKAPVKKGD